MSLSAINCLMSLKAVEPRTFNNSTILFLTSTSWQGPLLPGQYILLPNGGTLTNQFGISWMASNVCFSSTSCAIPLGGTNTMRMRILTVNGGTIGLADRIKHFKEYYNLLK